MQSLKQSQSGSFVIEALISVLLFAVGIVAMVMIAAQGASQTGQSKYRNDASYLAGELIGEMWVNANGAAMNTAAWQIRVGQVLPGGHGTATPSGNQVAIVITWPDIKQSGVSHEYTTTAEIVKN